MSSGDAHKMRPGRRACCMALMAWLSCGSAALAAPAAEPVYELVYIVELLPQRDGARATIRIGEGGAAVREISLHVDATRYREFAGDGEIRREKTRVHWTPPRTGGELRYFVRLRHERGSGGFDALITGDWALFRGGDVFPPATVRTLKGARANARLIVKAPRDWSVVTPYRESGENQYLFDHPHRRFDRPTGWMLAGKLGVRRTIVAGTRVAVAAPVGQRARRMDTLAFLRFTLPALREVFPDFDERLLVVMADDPMWRGGLSGPGSLYLHTDRPLISENATSTLTHELVHVAMSVAGDDHDDWIVEGIAEFYSFELMRRTGAISQRRFAQAVEDLEDWGKKADDMFLQQANGPVRARAAVVMHRLDTAISKATRGTSGLDNVVRSLLATGSALTYAVLCNAVRDLAPPALETLSGKYVPGARADDCRPTTVKTARETAAVAPGSNPSAGVLKTRL